MSVYSNAISKSILFLAVFALSAAWLPTSAVAAGAGRKAPVVQHVDGGILEEVKR